MDDLFGRLPRSYWGDVLAQGLERLDPAALDTRALAALALAVWSASPGCGIPGSPANASVRPIFRVVD